MEMRQSRRACKKTGVKKKKEKSCEGDTKMESCQRVYKHNAAC